MNEDRALYKICLTEACKRNLFDLEQFLAGKSEGARYRLTAYQMSEAREAIRTLYHIIARPDLEVTPVGRARADARFQQFLGTLQP